MSFYSSSQKDHFRFSLLSSTYFCVPLFIRYGQKYYILLEIFYKVNKIRYARNSRECLHILLLKLALV